MSRRGIIKRNMQALRGCFSKKHPLSLSMSLFFTPKTAALFAMEIEGIIAVIFEKMSRINPKKTLQRERKGCILMEEREERFGMREDGRVSRLISWPQALLLCLVKTANPCQGRRDGERAHPKEMIKRYFIFKEAD